VSAHSNSSQSRGYAKHTMPNSLPTGSPHVSLLDLPTRQAVQGQGGRQAGEWASARTYGAGVGPGGARPARRCPCRQARPATAPCPPTKPVVITRSLTNFRQSTGPKLQASIFLLVCSGLVNPTPAKPIPTTRAIIVQLFSKHNTRTWHTVKFTLLLRSHTCPSPISSEFIPRPPN
jgi:hypothetical protein